MCNNAMTYNQPDTVYYKAAKKLLHTGLRTLTAEKVRPYVPTISNFGELTITHLGFEPLEESFKAFAFRQEQSSEGGGTADHEMETGFSSGGETVMETARDSFLKNESPTKNPMDTLPDDMTPDEILEQVFARLTFSYTLTVPSNDFFSRLKRQLKRRRANWNINTPMLKWGFYANEKMEPHPLLYSLRVILDHSRGPLKFQLL